jgi:hypothetical protein
LIQANQEIAQQQARQGCEGYADALLGLADSWRFQNDGRTFDLRQNSAGGMGPEDFQTLCDSVSHQGLQNFLNETVEYLWNREDDARRFINSGRFMQQCVPANVERVSMEMSNIDRAELKQKLREMQGGVAQAPRPNLGDAAPVGNQGVSRPRQTTRQNDRGSQEGYSGSQSTRTERNSQNENQRQKQATGLGSLR